MLDRGSRLVGAALAASAAAALAATRRNDAEGPAPGTDGNSSPRATARAQRRNVTQPLAAVAPRTLACTDPATKRKSSCGKSSCLTT